MSISEVKPQTYSYNPELKEQAYARNELCRKVAKAVGIGALFLGVGAIAFIISGAALPYASLIIPGVALVWVAVGVGLAAFGSGRFIGSINNRLTSPLHLAARNGELFYSRLLLFLGADPGLDIGKGLTPLHTISLSPFREGQLEIMQLLLEKGANINAFYDSSGISGKRILDEAKALVAEGEKNPNATLEEYFDQVSLLATPLLVATIRGKVDIVRFLIDKGANLNLKYSGNTLLKIAQVHLEKTDPSNKAVFQEIVTILEKASSQNATGSNIAG